jgi:hypothetical protein
MQLENVFLLITHFFFAFMESEYKQNINNKKTQIFELRSFQVERFELKNC